MVFVNKSTILFLMKNIPLNHVRTDDCQFCFHKIIYPAFISDLKLFFSASNNIAVLFCFFAGLMSASWSLKGKHFTSLGFRKRWVWCPAACSSSSKGLKMQNKMCCVVSAIMMMTYVVLYVVVIMLTCWIPTFNHDSNADAQLLSVFIWLQFFYVSGLKVYYTSFFFPPFLLPFLFSLSSSVHCFH